MQTLRWYGPTLVLLFTMLGILILGPGVVRELAWNQTEARIKLAREVNASPTLDTLNQAFRNVGQIVKPSVVSIETFRKPTQPTLKPQNRKDIKHSPEHKQEGDNQTKEDGNTSSKPNSKKLADTQSRKRQKYHDYDMAEPFGNGSGWIYDHLGHIVTNYHVVQGSDRIVVRLHDGREEEAHIVGQPDIKTDIVVLKIPGRQLHPSAIADMDVAQGDIVFAFGSPFKFEFSMSQGIVSGTGRQLGMLRGRRGYENFIQTDASINPGNSGGPLTNLRGEVIGMNTAIATRNGGNQGLGFAIPIEMVTHVVRSIIREGKVRRGYLGIYIDTLTPAMARTFNFEGQGVLVMNPVPWSPAAKAGVKSGDIIYSVGDSLVRDTEDLRQTVASYSPQDETFLGVYREGKKISLPVIIGELPSNDVKVAQKPVKKKQVQKKKPQPVDKDLLLKLGFEKLTTMNEKLAQKWLHKTSKGVMVESIRPRSPAAVAELGRGHIITSVMDKPVSNSKELLEALSKHDLKKGVRLTIHVGDFTRFVLLRID